MTIILRIKLLPQLIQLRLPNGNKQTRRHLLQFVYRLQTHSWCISPVAQQHWQHRACYQTCLRPRALSELSQHIINSLALVVLRKATLRITFTSCRLTSRSLLYSRNLFLRKTSPMLFSHPSLNPRTTLSLLFQKTSSRILPNLSLRYYLNSNDFANRPAPVQYWLSLTSQLQNIIPVVTLGILLVIMGSKLTERRRKRKSRTIIRRKRRKKRRRVEIDRKRKKEKILKQILLKMIWMSVMIKTLCFWPRIQLLYSLYSQMIGF